MQTKIADPKYRIEVLPYAEAPWAPTVPGTPLRWAWRIADESGRPQMVGSSNLSEQQVRDLTEAAVVRLKNYESGKPRKINPTLKQKRTSHSTVGLPTE